MNPTSAIAKQWNLGAPVLSLVCNRRGDWVAAALGDGTVALFPANNEADQPKIIPLHDGVSLSLKQDADDHAFLSGGDDGKLFIIEPEVDVPTQLAEQKNKWIDQVAASVEGFRAYSVGKTVHLLDAEGNASGSPHNIPSSSGGLAFSPNGKRLAASHYNGVSLWWVNSKDSSPTVLEWKGSHLSVVWHPENKIIISAMQECALHGWNLANDKEMQMQGYAAKINSMEFTAKGKYLATSGADQAICWPFFGGGPWGKSPLTLGGSDGRLAACVAAHPKDDLVAVGYDDGMIILAPLDGRMEVMLHQPIAFQGTAITGMVWNAAGDCLFAAIENGRVVLFTLDSVNKAVKMTV